MSFIGRCLVKGIGLTGLGLIGYDSHVAGKLQSEVTAKSRDANAMSDAFNNTMFLDKPSVIKSRLKKRVFNFEMGNTTRTAINSTLGYFGGFVHMLIDNVVPLGLSLGAVLIKNKFVSKLSAIGLAAYGALVFGKDILGLGNKNDLNPPSL